MTRTTDKPTASGCPTRQSVAAIGTTKMEAIRSTRITRSMTASGQGARHHLLALPAEVRTIIIKKLIISPECDVEEDKPPRYSGTCLSLLRVCRTLRREAIFILGRSLRLTISSAPLSHVKESLPVGVWDHLREITFVNAPTLEELEELKQVKGLETVTWDPLTQPLGIEPGEDIELPEGINPNKWTMDLEEFVLELVLEHFDLGDSDDSVFERYYDLELPFYLSMYLPLFPGVNHPLHVWLSGFIDLSVVIDLTVYGVLIYHGSLIYHWRGRKMKPETGVGIEWTGKWTCPEYYVASVDSTTDQVSSEEKPLADPVTSSDS